MLPQGCPKRPQDEKSGASLKSPSKPLKTPAKRLLTDRALRAVKPAPPGQRTMIWDAMLPSFGVRITDRGAASFIVMRRVNGRLVRDVLGSFRVGAYPKRGGPLAKAREAARASIALMQDGVVPKEARQARALAAQRSRQYSFEAVAEDFIKRHVSKLKSGAEVGRSIRRELVGRWGARPFADITRRDVVDLLEEVSASGRRYVAYRLLAYARKLFNWAIARDLYGIQTSPCDRVKVGEFIGAREPRQRVLADDELRLVWRASQHLGYPNGPFVRLLILTGQRLREVANTDWVEIDLDKELWTLPGKRMKGNMPHEVPLSPLAKELVLSLPRFGGSKASNFVFSTTSGTRPISGFSKIKERIDALIEQELGAPLPGWRFHDLRRTMRTHLGGLPVPSDVAERVIAHRQGGVRAVYDLHRYRDEKRRALELWSARLKEIVEPAPTSNVVQLQRA
jgi:integrase